jgi:phage-related protein
VPSQTIKLRVRWTGSTRVVLRSWPPEVKTDIGYQIYRLEKGERVLDGEFLTNGMSEIRYEHNNVQYRVIYATKYGQVIILGSFVKKTHKTPSNELELAEKRLSEVDKEVRKTEVREKKQKRKEKKR